MQHTLLYSYLDLQKADLLNQQQNSLDPSDGTR